jgi:Holliday junction resolvase RusA-like endonuclease
MVGEQGNGSVHDGNYSGAGMTVVTLPMPPSTNNMFINGSRGRFRSQKYEEWILEAGWELKRQRPSKCLGPVSLSFEFEEVNGKRKRDISNLIKAPEDLLVKHGVIEADDQFIVRSITVSWSREVHGVRITIEPVVTAFPSASQTESANGSVNRP